MTEVVTETGRGEPAVEKLSLMRRSMVRRMLEGAAVPCFFLRVAADVTDLLAERRRLRDEDGATPSVNDFIVRAVAIELRRHPAVNSSYVDGVVETYPRVNVGVAVAIEGGLVVPAVYDADRKDVHAIAAAVREVADLAARAQAQPRAARRRHLHGLEPRHVRRGGLRPDHQPAAGRDPGRRRRCRRGRAHAPAPHARLRPPRADRRRGRAVPGRRSRPARTARGPARCGRTAGRHERLGPDQRRRRAGPLRRGAHARRCARATSLEKLRCNVLHNLACAMGAHTAGAALWDGVRDRRPAEATLLCDGDRVAAEHAAFANAALMHTRAQDDTHFAAKTHVGSAVMPAAYAIAERDGLSGAAFATAVIAGCEVAAAVGERLAAPSTARGFRATPVFGTLGAAAASASILGLGRRGGGRRDRDRIELLQRPQPDLDRRHQRVPARARHGGAQRHRRRAARRRRASTARRTGTRATRASRGRSRARRRTTAAPGSSASAGACSTSRTSPIPVCAITQSPVQLAIDLAREHDLAAGRDHRRALLPQPGGPQLSRARSTTARSTTSARAS